MTPSEIQAERQHIISTRLAILNEGEPQAVPTKEQVEMAQREADEWEFCNFRLQTSSS